MELRRPIARIYQEPHPPPMPMFRGNLGTLDTTLHLIPDNTRGLFYWMILFVSICALIGNTLAVRSIIKRKWKFLKKTCLISLAVADIFTVIIYTINNLTLLSNTLVIWTLGEFMCYFVPMAQVMGTTAGSLALFIVALDRYRSINLGKSWDPKPFVCILFAVILFLLCAVVSYPMFTLFDYKKVWIDYGPEYQTPDLVPAHMCVVVIKERLTVYYLVMAFFIFFPMLVVFLWFNFSIAALIWRHRKPLSTMYEENKSELEEMSHTSSKATSSSYSISHMHPILKKKENAQVEKKIRTFRIVIILMLSFLLCRFPYWCYYTLKVSVKVEGDIAWNITFPLVALNLWNCALDPLLYTFLSETMKVLGTVNDFLCKIFCCCFSNDDFEDFEKDNPFAKIEPIIQPNVKIPKPNCKVSFIESATKLQCPPLKCQPAPVVN